MSHCSSCGRYTGPYEACPYCGTRQSGRISIRTVKATAIVLSIVGLIALWAAATGSQIPQVKIGQIAATANMAYVQLFGRVTRGPDYYAESDYLAFTLDDGTGEIRVSAYRNETDDLRLHDRIPSLGDNVSVVGTVRVRDQGPSLTINVPDQVEVFRPEPVRRSIGSINTDDYLLRVLIRGQVWSVESPYEGLTLITLRDLTGVIPVPVGLDLQTLTGSLLPLEVGQSVQILGTVDLYQDTAQVVPVSTRDIFLLTEPIPIAHVRDVGTLTPGDVGKMVSIEGQVTDLAHLPFGAKFTLNNLNAEETILIWEYILSQIEGSMVLQMGDWLRVVGEVSLYNDEVEVIPHRAIDVHTIDALQGDAEAACTSIGDLSSDNLREITTLEGRVIEIWSFAGGFRLVLDDGTGQISVLLWLPVFDELPDRTDMDIGSLMRVTGELNEYQSEIQVVPLSGTDATIVEAAQLETTPTEIKSLTPADVGRRVLIQGRIIGAQQFSGGYRFQVSDGTGEIIAILWENVYQRIDNWTSAEVGAQVEILGLVDLYGGVLEILPQLPHHVKILH